MRSTRTPVVWLLELTIAGRLHRLSSFPLTVTTTAGEDLPFDGGLDGIDLTETLPGPGSEPDRRSVSIDLLLSDDLALLVSRGIDLSTATAELSLHILGDVYDLRDVLLCGRVQRPVYGGAGEPLSLTIADDPIDDVARVLPDVAVVDDESWPLRRQDADGKLYPWPWGQPGVLADPDGGQRLSPGSPALPVVISGGGADAEAALVDTLLIADGEIDAGTVGLWRETDSGRLVRTGTVSVTTTTDGRGRIVSILDISGTVTATRSSGTFWVDFGQGGFGKADTFTGSPIKNLGQLLRTLARQSSIAIDVGSWAALGSALPWPANGYVDSDLSPMDLIQELIEHTPVALISRPHGIAPVIWNTEATREQAIECIIDGDGSSRIGRPSVDRPSYELVDRITVAYGWDADRDRTLAERSLQPDEPTRVGEASSVYAGAAHVRSAGTARALQVEVPWADAVSSARVLHWLARSRCTTPTAISYDVEQRRAMHLEPGSVVTVTEAQLHLVDAVALVTRRTATDEALWRLDLLLLDPVVSAAAATGSGASTDPPPWTPVQ